MIIDVRFHGAEGGAEPDGSAIVATADRPGKTTPWHRQNRHRAGSRLSRRHKSRNQNRELTA
jgi:hypothetical protein